jgi:hypothetical protein
LRRPIGATTALAALASLALASHASASIEIGSHCVGDTYSGNATLVQIANDPADPLPAAAPSAGVITSWSVNVPPLGFAIPEKLKVMRPGATPNQFTTVAESGFEAVLGPASFEARIPVQAGDRLGVYASDSSGPLFCSITGHEGDVLGSAAGDTPAGATRSFLPAENNQLAMAAKIEPDADGDGYGDETQDRCPQSPASQSPCPPISLEAFPIVLKRSVLVLVSASAEAPVQVFGQVAYGAPRRARAHNSKSRHAVRLPARIAGLSGGSQSVKPGDIARFNVKLPKPVKRRLARLPRSRSLKGTITARATDLAGRVTDRTIAIRLPGQKRTHR